MRYTDDLPLSAYCSEWDEPRDYPDSEVLQLTWRFFCPTDGAEDVATPAECASVRDLYVAAGYDFIATLESSEDE
jgi:hypothetical protein